MKGIIFNLVQGVISDTYGEDAWDVLLDDAGLDGSYTSLGSYPDTDLLRLVGAASKRLEVPPDEVVRRLGQGAIPLLAERYPDFFDPHSSTKPFLLTLNEIIHPEVRKLYPGADVPVFDFDTPADGVLILGYQSKRKLCALAEGFVLGAAQHYGETVQLEQPECMLRDDVRCVIRCEFSGGRDRSG